MDTASIGLLDKIWTILFTDRSLCMGSVLRPAWHSLGTSLYTQLKTKTNTAIGWQLKSSWWLQNTDTKYTHTHAENSSHSHSLQHIPPLTVTAKAKEMRQNPHKKNTKRNRKMNKLVIDEKKIHKILYTEGVFRAGWTSTHTPPKRSKHFDTI